MKCILTLAAHIHWVTVGTEEEPVVCTVGYVRPQLPAVYKIQHNETGVRIIQGVLVILLRSHGWESQLPAHHL